MQFTIKFIVVILSLIAGMIAIILANRIMRKYHLNYLSSYFYFLIFTFIFSVYSVIGSQTIKFILNQHQSSAISIQSTEAVMIILGIPFLILAWYMFIRLSREFFKVELPKIFVILYFILFAVSFIGYGLLNVDIGGMETLNFFMDDQQLIWTFSGLTAAVFGYALLYIFVKLRSLNDINQRNAYRWFAIWYLIIMTMTIISILLSSKLEVAGLLFVTVLTSFHLVPVLFLNIYLDRFYVLTVEKGNFEDNLTAFSKKYEISNREAEIIELICKGMSNQEISDSLYISLQTVKDHVHRIFVKTGVRNRIQLSNMVDKANV